MLLPDVSAGIDQLPVAGLWLGSAQSQLCRPGLSFIPMLGLGRRPHAVSAYLTTFGERPAGTVAQIRAFGAAAWKGKVLLVDGIHDLGGMQGLGAVGHSPAEPVFHHRWEAVARALLAVVAGAVEASGGEFRHSIERMEPGHYLTSSYYEHWLTAAATLAVEHGLVTGSELEARAGGRFPLSGPVLALPVVDAGPDVGTPRFGVGDRVRVRDWHPPGHTRCPRYVRGKSGTVARLDGLYSVPDIEAHGTARRREPTYSVRFDAAELWGDGQRGVRVHVDLWDSYLEPS